MPHRVPARKMAIIKMVASVGALEDASRILSKASLPYGVLWDYPILPTATIEAWAEHVEWLARHLRREARMVRRHDANMSAMRRYTVRGPRALIQGVAQ